MKRFATVVVIFVGVALLIVIGVVISGILQPPPLRGAANPPGLSPPLQQTQQPPSSSGSTNPAGLTSPQTQPSQTTTASRESVPQGIQIIELEGTVASGTRSRFFLTERPPEEPIVVIQGPIPCSLQNLEVEVDAAHRDVPQNLRERDRIRVKGAYVAEGYRCRVRVDSPGHYVKLIPWPIVLKGLVQYFEPRRWVVLRLNSLQNVERGPYPCSLNEVRIDISDPRWNYLRLNIGQRTRVEGLYIPDTCTITPNEMVPDVAKGLFFSGGIAFTNDQSTKLTLYTIALGQGVTENLLVQGAFSIGSGIYALQGKPLTLNAWAFDASVLYQVLDSNFHLGVGAGAALIRATRVPDITRSEVVPYVRVFLGYRVGFYMIDLMVEGGIYVSLGALR